MELKLFPFCGHHGRIFRDSKGLYSIQCNICGNGTIGYGKLESAQEAWNRRPNND